MLLLFLGLWKVILNPGKSFQIGNVGRTMVRALSLELCFVYDIMSRDSLCITGFKICSVMQHRLFLTLTAERRKCYSPLSHAHLSVFERVAIIFISTYSIQPHILVTSTNLLLGCFLSIKYGWYFSEKLCYCGLIVLDMKCCHSCNNHSLFNT